MIKHIRWNSHQSHLQTGFTAQLKEGRFCDVTIACEDGRTLRAHRSVLCACSTYFNRVLTEATTGRDTLVIIKDCKYEDVKLIIEFMYRGEIRLQQEQRQSLFKTAYDLKIGGLTDVIRACTSSVDYNIDASTSDMEKATPENELFDKNTDQSDASPGSSTRRKKRRRSFNQNSERATNSTLQPTLEVLLPHAEVKEELMDDDSCWDNSYPEENDNYSTKYEEEYVEQSQSDNEMHSDAASSSQTNISSNDIEARSRIYRQIYEHNITANLQRDLEIATLKQQLSELQKHETTSPKPQYLKFLSPAEYNILRGLPPNTRFDSSFMLKGLKYMYKHNISKLKNASLMGRNAGENERRALSPEKMTVLRSMFDERIAELDIPDEEKKQRREWRSVNRTICGALHNVQVQFKLNSK